VVVVSLAVVELPAAVVVVEAAAAVFVLVDPVAAEVVEAAEAESAFGELASIWW
jgi:hypothetical protein